MSMHLAPKRVGNMFLAKQRHRQMISRKNATDVVPIMIMGNAQHLVKSVSNVDYKATSGNAVKQKKTTCCW